MSADLKLIHTETNEEKVIRSGWSWICFFFSFTGIPLFTRGLIWHGVIMLVMWICMFVFDIFTVYSNCSVEPCLNILGGDIVALIMVLFGVFYLIKVNQLELRKLQSNGWQVV